MLLFLFSPAFVVCISGNKIPDLAQFFELSSTEPIYNSNKCLFASLAAFKDRIWLDPFYYGLPLCFVFF